VIAFFLLLTIAVVAIRFTIAKNIRKAYQVWDDAENEKY
jgi:hypothetical protein